MVTLAEIRGQPRAIAQLKRALAQDRVAHAYLFCGPAHSGKYTTGLALATALNCVSTDPDKRQLGCGECVQCEKISAGNHPDVQTLQPEGKAQIIPISAIRKGVIPQLGHAPHEGRARVFLIEEALLLQRQAANALLKTLEEPPPRTHFIIATVAPDQLLPTIRSRCQRVSFAALPPDVRAELGDVDDDAADTLRELADQLARAADATGDRGVYEAAAAAAGQRKQAADVLELLASHYHHAARRAAFDQQLSRAAALSRSAALVLQTQLVMREHNAHATLSIEALLHQLRAINRNAEASAP